MAQRDADFAQNLAQHAGHNRVRGEATEFFRLRGIDVRPSGVADGVDDKFRSQGADGFGHGVPVGDVLIPVRRCGHRQTAGLQVRRQRPAHISRAAE